MIVLSLCPLSPQVSFQKFDLVCLSGNPLQKYIRLSVKEGAMQNIVRILPCVASTLITNGLKAQIREYVAGTRVCEFVSPHVSIGWGKRWRSQIFIGSQKDNADCRDQMRWSADIINMYRVSHHVSDLGWVDLDLGSSPGWWAAIVASYCPSGVVEQPRSET